jgi:hypothetical protein
MGTPRLPLPVKLICGLLSADDDLLRRARHILTKRFGSVDIESEIWPFSQTAYYEAEMGQGLKRQFLSFEKLIPPDALAQIKRDTNEIEGQIAEECLALGIPRPVNIDPGTIDLARLVLATTKDRSHRLYLGLGIHAEVTLHWSDGAWRVWPWTYPDYHDSGYHAFFSRVRQRLAEQRRAGDDAGRQSPA